MKIQRGKYIAKNADPHKHEPEHFIKCETCGGWIDCRDLGSVLDHEGPHSTGLERGFGEPAPLQPEYRDHPRLLFSFMRATLRGAPRLDDG